MTTEQPAVTDITVNLEALWLLQALLGIPRLASELRVRPYGQPRSTEWVTQHPGLGVLVGQGICDDGGVVRADIAERMAALAAPDVEVVILVSRGRLNWSNPVVLDDPATWRAIPDEQLRIVLSRRDGRWTSAVRTGEVITIDDCEPVDSERLEQLVCQALDSVHHVEPARITAVNIPLDSMLGALADHAQAGSVAAKQAALRAAGLRGAALAELAAALDEPQAEAVLYARAYVDAETSLSASVLNLRDTASGRVALYRLSPPHGSLQEWMAIAPATPAQVRHAVSTVLGSVTVRSWDAHERMST
jgi:EspG family